LSGARNMTYAEVPTRIATTATAAIIIQSFRLLPPVGGAIGSGFAFSPLVTLESVPSDIVSPDSRVAQQTNSRDKVIQLYKFCLLRREKQTSGFREFDSIARFDMYQPQHINVKKTGRCSVARLTEVSSQSISVKWRSLARLLRCLVSFEKRLNEK